MPGEWEYKHKGETISDEIGMFVFPVPEDGYYLLVNHYGNVTVWRAQTLSEPEARTAPTD